MSFYHDYLDIQKEFASMPMFSTVDFQLGKEEVLPPVSIQTSGVSFNGAVFRNCTMEFEQTRGMHYSASASDYKLTMKSTRTGEQVLPPLFVHYKDSADYRRTLMKQHIKVVLERISALTPAIEVWVEHDKDHLTSPTLVSSTMPTIYLRYGEHPAVLVGLVTNLVWMDDMALKKQVEGIIEFERAKDEEAERLKKMRRCYDPLYGFKEKMADIGWEYHYRFTIAQVSDKEAGYDAGDTLLSVKCHELTTMDQYVIIGPLQYVVALSREDLKQEILDHHAKALSRSRGKK